ncbi:hypothetical protein [Streptomyces sulphureus]|uniref:hypothetical protein n=1 Tax=Streptomyces sulphureus TaxID=47758 RepID=UPI00036E4540|nr:hypothetical protein [Streptomyces sulphureus]
MDNVIHAAIDSLGTSPDSYGPTLDTARDTAAVETVGTALAEELDRYRPEALAVWNSGDEMVLAHIVARELHADLLYASDVAGILAFGRRPRPRQRVAMLATSWTSRRFASLHAFAARTHDLDVVAAAAVIDTPALHTDDALPTIHLTAATRQEDAS